MPDQSFYLRAGIPSLDTMFRPPGTAKNEPASDGQGIMLAGADGISSICIAGPDGTGKTALAMHFASRYTADCYEFARNIDGAVPATLYVSSDLGYDTAARMWANFGLDRPNSRAIPFYYPQLRDQRLPAWLGAANYDHAYSLPLRAHEPDQLEPLAKYLLEKNHQPQIAFIDLASHAAGDDWGFVERLLATMEDTPPHTPRHLLVVDAMEGMETFAGNIDAFGQSVTRRARIAKLIRLARQKCHIIIVSEEPQEGARLPEQFVADVVLRLRASENQGYTRRTIEIEKARGLSHLRGRHPYVIRDGRGSKTGDQVNFDDPQVTTEDRWQSYFAIFPSLHARSRQMMESHGVPQRITGPVAGFGIRELDDMLARTDQDATSRRGDDQGLPSGYVSALIGDANTQKSFLAIAFLGHAFHDIAWKISKAYVGETLTDSGWLTKIKESATDAPAVVLVTTKDENTSTLVLRFYEQLKDEVRERVALTAPGAARLALLDQLWNDRSAFRTAMQNYLASRTICRRLGIHDTPSPVLFNIINRSVEAAQHIIQEGSCDACKGQPLPQDCADFGWRVRFALDDLNSLVRTYSNAQQDPLFIPFLLLSVRREGLSSLIVETQSGKHGMPALSAEDDDTGSELRTLSDFRLYTWHVPNFFGDHRIAIAAIPPMLKQDRKSPVLVRELEWYPPNSTSAPRVNREFELYAGLETGKPTLVPLKVHLYAETEAWANYISGLDDLWKRVFTPPGADRSPSSVVTAENAEDYDLLREVCELHSNTSLDYSLIIQVDEFWQHRDAFRSQADYLNHPPDMAAGAEPRRSMMNRRSWFPALPEDVTQVDRIPFVKDFGFLAFRERLWNEAATDTSRPGKGEQAALAKKRKQIDKIWTRLKNGERLSWPEVLEAASHVARWESARQSRPVPAFDLAMVAPATFSCLVLEIWFSEIYQTLQSRDRAKANAFATRFHQRIWDKEEERYDLAELLREYWPELYVSWLLLIEVLPLEAFSARAAGFGFRFGRMADPNAVMVRHWYKSASGIPTEDEEFGPMRLCPLPGKFTVRGDWYLATVRGSRSDRLADRAADLLSTVEANNDRLMRGLGLPTHFPWDAGKVSTKLWGWRAGKDEPGTLSYSDVLDLGPKANPDDFHWLWRGNLKNYYAVSPVWERWLYRILRRWKRTRDFVGTRWQSGFDLYNNVRKEIADGVGTPKAARRLLSWPDFERMRDLLIDELKNLEL